MTLNQSFIAELQMEAANTRKMLERVPSEKNEFKPHDKSMMLGRLAWHIADLPGWITMTMNSNELDLASMNYKPTMAETPAQLVAHFDKNVSEAIAALEAALPEDYSKMWTLRRGDHVIFTLPKVAVLRSMAYSHMYHHRGQLSVYLRLLDVAIPGMYGPSADDMAPAAPAQAN